MLTLWLGAFDQGLAYAGLALGTYLTLRVLNFPDLTVDGSFALGGGTAAMLISKGVPIPLALLVAFGFGSLAGLATGLIHTRLGVNDLFAGILTTTGLYSITLRLMGRSNIPLTDTPGFIDRLPDWTTGLDEEWGFALLLVTTGLVLILGLLLSTDFGLALRALGNNSTMARANGINQRRGLNIGIAVANGLVGLSGALVALFQGFADVTMGIGSLILGLGMVIIGESIFKPRSIPMGLLAAVVGAIVFRGLIAVALALGLEPVDLKLVTAVLLLIALAAGRLRIPGLSAQENR